MKNLRVTVDGQIFNVTVEMAGEPAVAPAPRTPVVSVAAVTPAAITPAPATEPSPLAAEKSATGPGDVPSPLTGKIVSIEVAVGQSVAEGDKIATIEAMKMNTYVFAPKAGKVTAIIAVPGSSIEEGGTLLVIG